MKIRYDSDRVVIINGDSLDVLREFTADSMDAIVTDPPYGLEFMGKDWDAPWKGDVRQTFDGTLKDERQNAFSRSKVRYGGSPSYNAGVEAMVGFQQWFERIARECLRVLKPGGYILAFGGTRTSHRLACAIEDAGFEVRDALDWVYGSGFPKSLNVGRELDMHVCSLPGRHYDKNLPPESKRQAGDHLCPESHDGDVWRGWGSALKPAHEPIIVARKPLVGTVAVNVEKYGTGGLNVDGCRVDVSDDDDIHAKNPHTEGGFGHAGAAVYGKSEGAPAYDPSQGRWPPNVLLTHSPACGDECAPGCPAAGLDAQSGHSKSVKGKPRASKEPGEGWGMTRTGAEYDDDGGASRFFPVFEFDDNDFMPFLYQAKAARKEREYGCEGLTPKKGHEVVERAEGSAGVNNPRAGAGRTAKEVRNGHPTVKPVALMRWLCRLVTPPGGTIVDPFLGSGTTGVAALQEGFTFIGIEKDEEHGYIDIAEARIKRAESDTSEAKVA